MTSSRDRIIETARELFWLKGYQSTSVADILSRSQLNSGSLYHFFPGKQDVLAAVLESYRDGIFPMLIRPAWEGVEDPVERIFALLARYRENIVLTDCAYGCPIGSLALELHEPDPAIRKLLEENFAAWKNAVKTCLEQAGGRIRAGTDLDAVAEFILISMEGAVMLARTSRNVAPFDRMVEQLRSYLSTLMKEEVPC